MHSTSFSPADQDCSDDELRDSPHLAELLDLCAREATGEFAVAVDLNEVHVFVVEGRVAWATSSQGKNALAQYLLRTCAIDPQRLSEVVQACRHSGKPFGETVVQEKLATAEQLLCALRAQVSDALETLLFKKGESVFLPTNVTYDNRFTFETRGLVTELCSNDGQHVAQVEAVERVLQALPAADWVDVVSHGDVIVHGVPKDPGEADTPSSLSVHLDRIMREGGFVMVALRSIFGVMVGVPLPSDYGTLWCAHRDRTKLGHTCAALDALDAELRPPVKVTRHRSELPELWSPCSEASGLRGVQQALEMVCKGRADLLGGVVFDAKGSCLAGVLRHPYTPQDLFPFLMNARAFLGANLSSAFALDSSTHAAGYEQLAACATTARVSVYLTQLADEPRHLLAVFVRRSGPRGLGWVILDALERQVKIHVASS